MEKLSGDTAALVAAALTQAEFTARSAQSSKVDGLAMRMGARGGVRATYESYLAYVTGTEEAAEPGG